MRLNKLEDRLKYTVEEHEEVQVITFDLNKVIVMYSVDGHGTFTKEFDIELSHWPSDIGDELINKINEIRRFDKDQEWTLKNKRYAWFSQMKQHFSNLEN